MPKIPDGMKFIQLDLSTEAPDVIHYDRIYHLASTVNEYSLLKGEQEDIQTNCTGTFNLLEAIRKQNPWTRLVYVSTFFVVGDPPELPVTEQTICRPKGLYGITKLAAEQMCLAYRNIFGLNIRIARLTNVYGDNQPWASQRTAAMNWMIQSCVLDKTISLYDGGKIRRDYVYIDDAVRGIKTVGECGQSGEVYFIGSGEGVSFAHMVNIMQYVSGGGNIRIVESPVFHQRVGIGDFWINNNKMRMLGWEPYIDLDEGIARTVGFYERLNNV
jgi:UDP-glucose 4-epimerase